MNVILKGWLAEPGTVRAMPVGNEGVWLEGEVSHPPSMAGRSCQVYVSAEQVVGLLKEMREQASRQRRTTLGEAEAQARCHDQSDRLSPEPPPDRTLEE